MSVGRIFLAALAGGVIVFAWEAIFHTVLPLGRMGQASLPAEHVVIPQLKQVVKDRGFYRFPGLDETKMSKEDQDAWAARYRTGPRGVLIYDPSGAEPLSPAQFGAELASTVLAAFILAVVLTRVRAGVIARGLLAAALGVFAAVNIDVSYWNWDRFPGAFALASMIEQGVGWLVAGLVMAAVLGGGPQRRLEH